MLRICSVAFISLVLSLSSGCTPELDQVVEHSLALVRERATEDVEPLSSSPPPSQAAPKLYIDASQSMAGFLGCHDARTKFDLVVDRLANDLGLEEATLFGEPARGGGGELFSRHDIDRDLHCPDLYNRLQNPDFRLVEHIEADSLSRVHIYLTDGVQSASSAATPSPSVRALQRWMAKGGVLAMVAFRSAFSGPGWSEQQGRWIGDVEVEDRPFYAFIFAPSDAALQPVLDRVRSSFPDANVVRLGEDGVRCRVELASYLYEGNSNPAWAMLQREQVEQLGPGLGSVGGFRCEVPTDHPLSSVTADVSARSYRTWNGTAFSEPQSPPSNLRLSADSVVGELGASTATVLARIQDDPSTRFGFLELALRPSPGRLRADLLELSTESDASPDAFDQTYRLHWMLEHLVRARLERVPAVPYFLTVEYR